MTAFRRWCLVVAMAMALTGCGLPSAFKGLQRATGSASPTPLSSGQETVRLTMQHVLDLLNNTQREGATTLTTRIASSGHTNGHANTAMDYALSRVPDKEATLAVTWHFNDPITNTDISGTIELRGIRVESVTYDPSAEGYIARMTYAYRETPNRLGDTGDHLFLQGYFKSRTGPDLRPVPAPAPVRGRTGSWSVVSPNQESGSIHIPLAPMTWAIRSAMTIPEGLVARSDQQALDVQSAQWLSPGDDEPKKLLPTYNTGDVVHCGLPQGFDGGPIFGNVNVEVGQIMWGVQEGRQASPGLHPNEQIVLEHGWELIKAGMVVVNPDGRTGTMQGSQPRPQGGTNTVSGRWVCPPGSVIGGAYS